MSTVVREPARAVATAAAAAREWAEAAPTARARALEAVADALEANRAELVAPADAETRLGPVRLNGELSRTTFQLRLFADQVRGGEFLDVRIDRPDPQWPTGPRPELRRYRTALGPVLVFAASNFPFAFSVAGGDTASAWAAGCPVIVKAHPGHPELSRCTAEIIQRALAGAGAPDGVFALIEGQQAGIDALRHPALRAAAFTGSERGGLALARIAAERPEPIPFYGELGSVNPVVVTPAAARARGVEIAKGYVRSLTLGAGQFCTNPGLLFVPAGDGGLVDEIVRLLREVPPAPMLGDRIAQAYLDGARRLAGRPGTRKLVWPDDAASVGPRLLTMDLSEFTADTDEAAKECFGPLGMVVTYERPDEVAAVLATLPGQLTASLHAEPDEASELADVTSALADRSGRVLWNEWPTGVSVTHAMQHGGPFPATTAPTTTSVGTAAIERFLRPVSYQSWPAQLLPPPLRDDNPWGVPQRIDAEDS
ncbi:aldehyde dehydrogenase (NADP(+)) [Streptomyces noursei]|uniref:aldehyde dehydrogenase (NADP(+)) n=1 Tax=Streptomyces noursei TaxID=1971 RepID=UPI0016760CDC|nr:aldehyde dehydrogenase (NADP(+)) [Streptomyces noursei]MCZ1019623.1 aldehyde dehydrogenase (NADP(+)) [Streptomyces noursei]GGX43429.1 aldehyde dehydrogenase [Streptomyces noursei]